MKNGYVLKKRSLKEPFTSNARAKGNVMNCSLNKKAISDSKSSNPNRMKLLFFVEGVYLIKTYMIIRESSAGYRYCLNTIHETIWMEDREKRIRTAGMKALK
jgi:hypothetical protein